VSGVRIAHAPDGTNAWWAVYRPVRAGWPAMSTAAEKAAFREHARYLDELTRDGVCVVAGPLLDESQTVAVLDGLPRREARALCEKDPMVAGGHFTVELVPMRLAFERGRARRAAAPEGTG
jgi:uncharacterized protein YciI